METRNPEAADNDTDEQEIVIGDEAGDGHSQTGNERGQGKKPSDGASVRKKSECGLDDGRGQIAEEKNYPSRRVGEVQDLFEKREQGRKGSLINIRNQMASAENR
jgi:hypothetical protein